MMSFSRCVLAPAALAAAFSLIAPAAAQNAPAARRASQPPTLQVIYNLALVRDGRRIEVSPSHAFRNGDQVALQVRANRSAYVYVFNRTITGDPVEIAPRSLVVQAEIDRPTSLPQGLAMIYPEPGQQARVHAGVLESIPARGRAMTVVDPVGVEKLYVVVSTRPLNFATLTEMPDDATAQPAPPAAAPDAPAATAPAAPAAPQSDSDSDVQNKLSRFIEMDANTDNAISQEESRSFGPVDKMGKPVGFDGNPIPGSDNHTNPGPGVRPPRPPVCSTCATCRTCRRAMPKHPGQPILIDISLAHGQ